VWFPRPGALSDIRILGPSDGAVREWLFDALWAEDAIEWRHKVGVAGRKDGSAKSGSRLLSRHGWVLKTNVDFALPSEESVRRRLREALDLTRCASFWHPEKIWAQFFVAGLHYPLTATPEVHTLRQLTSAEERLRGWTAMVELSVEVAVRLGIGLDLNPSNFGYASTGSRIYYIDDEWYSALRFTELAGALVSRIPEEPEIEETQWEDWGRTLCSVLRPLCPTAHDRDELLDGVSGHPIAERFRARRAALCEGIRSMAAGRRKGRRRREDDDSFRGRTAVFADVHGNLAALDAVLERCSDLGVDSYLFLGDAVGYGPFPRECVQRLATLPSARFVRGNHDHAVGTGVLRDGMNPLARTCAEWTYGQLGAAERQWLLQSSLTEEGPDWIAVHGAPKDPQRFLAYVYELTYQDNLEYLSVLDMRLCFCGHTHVQSVHEKTPDGRSRELGAPRRVELGGDRVFIVNPGSVGQPRDGDSRAAFAVWDRLDNCVSLHRVEYSVDSVVRALAKAKLPPGLGERLLAGS
jgi:diadenosine tetraphosphatase ApaH/serine/threonine PP2A family protein phosphatase